ncbi:hypothetical protein FIV42_15955 [Persicimonas caeni]|uniref:Uncharacterized protein n=1 Tax=Persicimonas caeni TaxID=2292766 RepID=A0A4Y6PVN5_PERCE|nr:hypothetical protein [Persicimonas caeni]QDG52179.1 hypothetical protein FIV42_15955 [Persicimonas caeni]QED33401.1 hypothetical protein FRD00_15950 [Persicimonas caeni]
MFKEKKEQLQKLLGSVEAGRDIAPKSVGFLATLSAEVDHWMRPTEIERGDFHQRVQTALATLTADKYIDRAIGRATRLLESEHLSHEEDSQLAYLFEQVGALLFFQVELDEARRVELLDALGEFLKNRRRRGEFKATFLDTYRNRMSQVAQLPIMSTAIHMLELEHLLENDT